jgi:hypothetical protein
VTREGDLLSDKIIITPESLNDPRIDAILADERAIREVAARSKGVSLLRRFFFSSMFYSSVVGALGALAGWALLEPLYHEGPVVSGTVTEVSPGRAIAVCSSCGTVVRLDAANPGHDQCSKCQATLSEYPARGVFRLSRIEVYVLPGETRVVRDGRKGDLGSVEEIGVSEQVRVSGSILDHQAVAATRLDFGARGAGREPGEPDLLRTTRNQRWVGMSWFAVIGAMIALMVGAVEGIVSLNPRQSLLCGGIGMAIGFGGGLAGLIPAETTYAVSRLITFSLIDRAKVESIRDFHGWAFFTQIVGRSLAWGVVGMTLALGQGVAVRSRKLIYNGLIGGCLGGLFGGLLFDPIDKLAGGDEEAALSRCIGFMVIGLLVGLFIGLVEQLSKEAWLLLRSGPLHGKQFVLYTSAITIGGANRCDIFLFKDPLVAAEHARLVRVGRAYELIDLDSPGGTSVNGERVGRRILRDGDVITIGGTELEFLARGV